MITDEIAIGEIYSKGLLNTKELFVGLECEIEGVNNHGNYAACGFSVTNDGSLRNDGYEYITPPMEVDRAIKSFAALHKGLDCRTNEKFSQRTSIHVHANCLNMTSDQVRNVILMYALFEEAFFLMCESNRYDNIHCVPLTETYLPSMYKMSLPSLIGRWHKYTALNIKPLVKYGTIEFRHMQGHDDVELLRQWLGSINRLFVLSQNSKLTLEAVTDEQHIREIYNELFGDTQLRDMWVVVRGLMTNSIIDVKLGLL